MSSPEAKRGFLIMPFDSELRWLHETVINASVAKSVRTRRGDDIFEPGAILQQIFNEIDEADVVIAVCTGKNANVFFELGYAWQIHSPILIASDTADLPFDVAAFRVELYGRDSPGADRETLPFRLERAIEGVLAKGVVPRGRRLTSPPLQRQVSRLTARMEGSGGSQKIAVTNAGTTSVLEVDISAPPEVQGFQIHSDELPVTILRPGETIRVPALSGFGGGPRIFDLTLTGKTEQGDPVEHKSKISL